MKKLILVFFLLIVPSAFAAMDIDPSHTEYNLGDKIYASVSLIEEKDIVLGSVEARLKCSNYDKDYYVLNDFNLEKSVRSVININPLIVKNAMLGECLGECHNICRIKVVLKDQNEFTIDQEESEEFIVRNVLNSSCEPVKTKPGKDVNIVCEVKKGSENAVNDAAAEIFWNDQIINHDIDGGILGFVLSISENMPASLHKGDILIKDNKGNSGRSDFEVLIEGIPTRIEHRTNKESYLPNDEMKIMATLFDHVSDVIDSTIRVELLKEDEIIFYHDALSSYWFNQTLGDLTPGKYRLRSSSQGIIQEDDVIIEEIRKIIMSYDNQEILIKNVGNVDYKDKKTIVLEGEDGKNYEIKEKIELKPGEIKKVELSKKVSSGNYNIILPEDCVKSQFDRIVSNVELKDERAFYMKIGSGITGAAVATAETVTKRPLVAGIILVIMILGIFIYARGSFKPKKEKNTEPVVFVNKDPKKKEEVELGQIFEDFKYEKY